MILTALLILIAVSAILAMMAIYTLDFLIFIARAAAQDALKYIRQRVRRHE